MKLLRINYRHLICIAVLIGFACCTVFLFFDSVGRFIESIRDVLVSIVYFFCKVLRIDIGISPTVNELPKYPFFDFFKKESPTISLPSSIEGFKEDWASYWQFWASAEGFVSYINFLLSIVQKISILLMFFLPFLLCFKFLFKSYLTKSNNDYDVDSTPLVIFKAISNITYVPVKKWLRDFMRFVVAHRPYVVVAISIWILNFNIATIVLEAIAYYLYFVVTFDVVSIYFQVYKLFLDLSIPLNFIPIWVWVLIGLFLFDRFRRKIGFLRLDLAEKNNRSFISSCSYFIFIVGTIGSGKSTMVTDILLSVEAMFREKAYELILECDLRFPYFSWINLENELKKEIERHRVYSLATCGVFVESKKKKWLKNKTVANLFGYDYEKYGLYFYDNLKEVDIWEVIDIYTKLYFIYTVQSSLIISNYSVRTSGEFVDCGNFPKWATDFFNEDSKSISARAKYSHIIDFDMLRLGKKLLKDNPNRYAFGFGAFGEVEVGKNRLNSIELQGVKKEASEANQKNDLTKYMFKMARHASLVSNYPFFRYVCDEQRPTSWGANESQLADTVYIKNSKDFTLAMPFFSLGELLYSFMFGKFNDMYLEYRFCRGDNTLLMYLIKKVVSKYYRYYKRIHNLFDIKTLLVEVERGLFEGQRDAAKYYITSKKVYSKRFSSDCFSAFFMQRSLKSQVGIEDLPTYSSEKATVEEMQSQNSYFYNDMVKFD